MIASIKSPFTGGQVELLETPASTVFRKEEFSYTEYSYRCVDTGRTFTTDELDTRSLRQVYDQYCVKHGIPKQEEIKQIRKKYGLSAVTMSEILGLGDNQYRLYEEGSIPSESVGKLIRLIDSKANMMCLLEASRSAFSPIEYARLYSAIRSSTAQVSMPIGLSVFSEMRCTEQVSGNIIKLSFLANGYYKKRNYSNANGYK